MAEATGGEAYSVEPGELDKAEAALKEVLRKRAQADPYEFIYNAPSLSPGTRSVEVAINSQAAGLQYEVPSEPLPATRLCSLKLTVEVGDRRVTRILAGHRGKGSVEARHIDEVRGALMGLHMLAFEGPPPSISVLLDDMLQAKLGVESIDKAIGRKAPLPELIEELGKGLPCLPGELVTLLGRTQAMSGDDYSMTTLGLRTVLFSSHPVLNSDELIYRLDILPFEQPAVLAKDKKTVLEQAIRSSVRLAVAEAAIFPDSTVARLEGERASKAGGQSLLRNRYLL